MQFFCNPLLLFDVLVVSVGFGLEVYDKYESLQGNAEHGVDEDEVRAADVLLLAPCSNVCRWQAAALAKLAS